MRLASLALLLSISIASRAQTQTMSTAPTQKWPTKDNVYVIHKLPLRHRRNHPRAQPSLPHPRPAAPQRSRPRRQRHPPAPRHRRRSPHSPEPRLLRRPLRPGQPFDITKYFLILPDDIGQGDSSKPSDGLRMKFPQYDYDDMVRSQYIMLTEGMHVDHLRLILGTSMGCMQSWVWGETYPQFMDALAPFACYPTELAGRNRMTRYIAIESIKHDPAWKDGEYTSEPTEGLRGAAAMLLVMGSAPLQMQKNYPTRAQAEKYVDDYMARTIAHTDANNFIYYVNASRNYNPEPKLSTIVAPALWINSADDFINPPELRRTDHQRRASSPRCPRQNSSSSPSPTPPEATAPTPSPPSGSTTSSTSWPKPNQNNNNPADGGRSETSILNPASNQTEADNRSTASDPLHAEGEPVIDRRRLLYTGLGLAASSALSLRLLKAAEAYQPPWRQPVASSQTLTIGGATLTIDLGTGNLDLPHDAIILWVRRAAEAVTKYYGRFPVTSARVLILPSSGSGVHNGTTWGNVGGSPAFTRIRVGEHTTSDQLRDDWMMTHELLHTGLPSLPDQNHWLEEGIAVYVEPIARVQAGQLAQELVWRDLIRDMPQGNPAEGDQGLDRTHTWARTYWGGAGFCLLADIELRKQTQNHQGLQQALQAINAAGGTIDHDWPIDRTLATADKTNGTEVLSTLYKKMSSNSVPIDFETLWTQLGVAPSSNTVTFNPKAPLAEIRQAIFA